MKLSDLSIQKPVFAWMLMAALLVFGGLGGMNLGVSKMPDVDFPQVGIRLRYPGAAPEAMETDVVEIVEDACMAVEGIRDISSTSKQGEASINIEFDLGRDIDAALQDVQTKIAEAQRRLPPDLEPPVVSKENPEESPIMWVSLSGPQSPAVVSDTARFLVKERLQTVAGVGSVTLGGHRARNVRVWIDAQRLDAYGLTATDVLAALRREHVDVPAGRIESGEREVNVRTQGEALDLAQFRDLIVADRGGTQVRLRDVALVEDGLEDRRMAARTNGLPAQGVGIRKQRGANAVEVARLVKERVAEIRTELPKGLQLDITFDSTQPVKEAIDEILFTIVLSVLLTGVVCWMFLGSLGSTVNVLLAIPTSLIGTFGVMWILGFTLNTFTLLGLSLAVGIVVDDAIMVLENIFRHAEKGEERIRAAVVGAREIAFAAMAASAAIVAIFLPVAFMQGIIGAFLFQFGVTISVAVLLSLLEALTLTPSRAAQFLTVGERRSWFGRALDRGFERLSRVYRATLASALRLRWLTVLAGVAAFAAAFPVLLSLRREMTPSQDVGRVLARIKTPVGSSIDFTDERIRRCEEIVFARKDVETTYVSVGGFGGGEVNSANVFITMVPREERTASMQDLMTHLRKEWGKIPGIRVSIEDLSLQGFTPRRSPQIEFSVRGPDWEALAGQSQEILARMRESDLFQDADTDYQVGMPEARILPDRDRAAAMGVSMQEISETVNALVGGVRAGQFKEKGRNYDVRVRLLSGQRVAPEDVGRLRVRARDGSLVPLASLVEVETKPTLLAITRRARERAIKITAGVPVGKSEALAAEQVKAIAGGVLRDGYSISFAGSAAVFEEAQFGVLFALGLGAVIAYMILAAQFNSFAHPVSVLAAMPFSLTGAVLALWVFDLSVNMYSAIGVILLMGIVKKNSILLVDFTNQRRVDGLSRDEALLDACPVRLRPILMTTCSTIAGALPAALAFGPGAELRQPMAVAVIGGLVSSTLLTLYVVPALYSLLDGLTLAKGGAAAIERDTLAVLADLQAEEMEQYRHHGAGGAAPPPVPGDVDGDGDAPPPVPAHAAEKSAAGTRTD